MQTTQRNDFQKNFHDDFSQRSTIYAPDSAVLPQYPPIRTSHWTVQPISHRRRPYNLPRLKGRCKIIQIRDLRAWILPVKIFRNELVLHLRQSYLKTKMTRQLFLSENANGSLTLPRRVPENCLTTRPPLTSQALVSLIAPGLVTDPHPTLLLHP